MLSKWLLEGLLTLALALTPWTGDTAVAPDDSPDPSAQAEPTAEENLAQPAPQPENLATLTPCTRPEPPPPPSPMPLDGC